MLPTDNNKEPLADSKQENETNFLAAALPIELEKRLNPAEEVDALKEENHNLQEINEHLKRSLFSLAQEAAEQLFEDTYPKRLEEISNLKLQLEELQNEKAFLNSKLKQNTRDKELLAESHDESSEKLLKIIEKLESNLSQQNKQSKVLEKKLLELNEEHAHLKRVNEEGEQNNQALAIKFNQATAALSELKELTEILRKDEQVIDEKDNHLKRPLLFDDRFDDRALELTKAKDDITKLRLKVDILEGEKSDLNDELNASREHQSVQTPVLGENSLNLNAELLLEENQNKLEQLHVQLKEVGEKQLENEKEIEEKNELITKLMSSKEQLESVHQKIAQETQEIIHSLKDRVFQLEKERNELNGKFKILEDNNQNFRQQRDDNQENVKWLQTQLSEKGHQLLGLDAAKENLEVKIKEKDLLTQKLIDEKTNLKQVNNTQEQRITLIQEEKEELKKLVFTKQNEYDSALNQVSQLENQLKDSQEKLQAFEHQFSEDIANQKTIELLQIEKSEIEKDRDAYKNQADIDQQKIKELTEKSKQVLQEKTAKNDQLKSDYRAPESLEPLETIYNVTGQVVQLEKPKSENHTLHVVEDNKNLQQENKLGSELNITSKKLRQNEFDKLPAELPIYSMQTNTPEIPKKRHVTSDTSLTEEENFAQQSGRSFKKKKFSLASSLNNYGIDDESQITDKRSIPMTRTSVKDDLEDQVALEVTSSDMPLKEEGSLDGDSYETPSEETKSLEDDSSEKAFTVIEPELAKKLKIDNILSSLSPECVANELKKEARSIFLQSTKPSVEENSLVLPILDEHVGDFCNQHVDTYKASLSTELDKKALSELESEFEPDQALNKLLAITGESNSRSLKAIMKDQADIYAQNYLALESKFKEVATEVIADQKEPLGLALGSDTLAKKTIQNPKATPLIKKLLHQMLEKQPVNFSSDEQEVPVKDEIEKIFAAEKDEIKSVVDKTLAELDDIEKKRTIINQLFSNIDHGKVSRVLVNQANELLAKDLGRQGYWPTKSTSKQLKKQVNKIIDSGLETAKKKLQASLIEKNNLQDINTLKENLDHVIEQLINTQIDPSSLSKQATDLVRTLAHQEITSYQNKTPQDLEKHYKLTEDFTKYVLERLHEAMQSFLTCRELHDFILKDSTELSNILTLINDGTLAEKKIALQEKLSQSNLTSKDIKSYKQAIKSIEEICAQKEKIFFHIGRRLPPIQKVLDSIIKKNDLDSTQTIVKMESFSHLFKVIKTEEELVSTRKDFVDKLSSEFNKHEASVSDLQGNYTVAQFGSESTLLEAIRINTPRSFFKKEREMTFTYKALKKDHVIEFSVDSINGNVSPKFIKKNIENIDFVKTSTQSMLELAQGTGEGPENKGLGILILNTNNKNWKTRYAFIQAHLALFPEQAIPLVLLEGKYSYNELNSDKSLKSELKKIEDKFIKEYEKLAASDEYVNSFNTQTSLLSQTRAP